MRYRTILFSGLSVGLGLSLTVWAQAGAGRGAAQSGRTGGAGRGAAQTAGGRGGGRAATAGEPAPGDLYSYDASAPSGNAFDTAAAESHQTMTLDGRPFAYTARVGFLDIDNATTGQSEAHIFYTYYAKDGVTDAGTRPVLFVVGGAPGVAAAWQEFTGLGPKRLATAADGSAGLPPYHAVDNPNTVLDRADLVFANPVGTAYSRPDAPALADSFWTSAGDTASLAAFVRGFLTTYDRWNSPRLLAGADAGTGRVADLALYLTDHQIPVNGVALFSPTVTADATAGDTQFLTLVPTETLTAWAHKGLGADLQGLDAAKLADQARQFASREYLHALYKGARMTDAERAKATADLARLTGVAPSVATSNDLRLTWDRFEGALVGQSHLTFAMSDTRVASYDGGGGGRRGGRGGGRGGFGLGAPPAAPLDIAENRLAAGVLTGYLDYLTRDLGFKPPSAPFYLLGGGMGTFTASASDDNALPGLFARNPALRVLVGVEYFDADTPFYAADFSIAHWSLPPEARAHGLVVDHFASGRDVYADAKASPALHDDLVRLIEAATGAATTTGARTAHAGTK